MKIVNRLIKKTLNQIGLDVIRLSKIPTHTFLGLRHLPIKTVIDVGANEGQFAKMISNIFPKAHIYCFEPIPVAYAKLNKWAEQRGGVTIFNVALGESEGEADMLIHPAHSPSSSLLETTEICETIYPFTKQQVKTKVKLTTLDKALFQHVNSLAPDILVKLDVQGYEDRVIKGGEETFKTAKACILEVCLDQLYENQATFKDILSLLYKLGYQYSGNLDQAYADDGHTIFIDAVFSKL
ncbi:MAG TPA: FkbM family methyltransferase [Candidatus Limnocylindrales bacterium]|nr:FkbM family methyltransferase [Candidatus Limnocylindrales bacterium]